VSAIAGVPAELADAVDEEVLLPPPPHADCATMQKTAHDAKAEATPTGAASVRAPPARSSAASNPIVPNISIVGSTTASELDRAVVVTVTVEDEEPVPGVTAGGLNVQLVPAGRLVHASVTGALNSPPCAFTVAV
jgi:hypothetical protein